MSVTLATVLWVLSVASAAAFQPRGTAPYSNATSITTSDALVSSSSFPSEAPNNIRQSTDATQASGTITSEHAYPSSSSQYASGRPSPSLNGTNTSTTDPSCTVHIPNANLEWWYAATYDSAVGTLTENGPNFTYNGYLTLIPNTATLDLSSAISTDTAWTPTVSYDSEWDTYWTVFDVYSVIPTAASTSVVTQNAALPLPSGNLVASSDYTLYELPVTDLPPPAVPIATIGNSTAAMTSATPFAYFTAYEVEAFSKGTATTKTVSLAQPSAFEYQLKGIESSATATGPVPDDFLQRIPESSCRPGTVQGTVTVLVVVNLFYFHRPHANPFIVHFESSALGWEDTTVEVQATSKGVPFTMDPDPTPTKTAVQTNAPTSKGTPGTQHTSPKVLNAGSSLPNVKHATLQTVGAIGTNPVIVGPSSVVVVGSQTIKVGGPAVTIGGTLISVAPSATAIIVGGQTSTLPIVANPGSPSQTIGTVAGMPVVVGPSSSVILGSQTLQPGGSPLTIGGTPVSLASGAAAIVVGTKTSSLPRVIFPGDIAQTQAPAPPVLTIGSSTLTANAATQFFVSPGQTLTPGGTAVVDGTTLSLGPSAAFIVVKGSTQILAPLGATGQPEIVIGESTITALSGDSNNNQDAASNGGPSPTFVVSGQTLVPGHAITVDGTIISLAPSGSFVVINGMTTTLAPQAMITNPPFLTIGSHTYTAAPGTGTSFIIDGQTLTPGGTITVDGTTISLAPGATELIYGSSGRSTTTALFPATTTRGLVTTTGLSSAPASAGASGVNGEAAATTSAKGVGYSNPNLGIESYILGLIIGILDIWA